MKSFYRLLILSLPLVLGLVLLTGLFSSLALAQEPVGDEQQVWLILDTARPLEEVLPPLLAELEQLQQFGQLEEYATSPQRSGEGAAPGLAVTARPQVLPLLARLPGVLAVLEELPPEPGVGIEAVTVITGLVTIEGSTTAIPNVYVNAYDTLTYLYAGDDLDGPTDATGQYTITVSPVSGKVKLEFEPPDPYGAEWWNDKDGFAAADAVTAAGGAVTGINAALSAAGFISGTVQVAPSTPMVGHVQLFTVDGLLWEDSSTSDGNFLFEPPPGSYKLFFYGPDSAPELYQDKTTFETADTVTVTSGQTTTITAVVSPTGFITGVVTNELSPTQVIPGAEVGFYTEFLGTSRKNGFTYADASGVYTFPSSTGYVDFGLGGQHFVDFWAYGYQSEFYNNIKSGYSPLDGDPVTVTPGQTTTVNAALFPGGAACISGTVFGVSLTGTTGISIPDTYLTLFFYDEPYLEWYPWGNTSADDDGWYKFCNLPNDTYQLLAGAYGDPSGLSFDYSGGDDDIIPNAWEWYNDAGLMSEATDIVITNGVSQTINVNLGLGACIQGQILPYLMEDIEFDIQDAEDAYVPFFASGKFYLEGEPYDDEGHIVACGLPSGDYTFNCYGWNLVNGNFFGQEEVTLTAGSSDPTSVTCQLMLPGIYLPLIMK